MVLESMVLGFGVVIVILLGIFVRTIYGIGAAVEACAMRVMNEIDYQHVWDVVEKGVFVTYGHIDRVKKNKAAMTIEPMSYVQTVISDVLLQQGFNLKAYNLEGMIEAVCAKNRINLER